jgi:hypothetical protein
VSSALQAYADRGVFRGFRAVPAVRGRLEYQFMWLLRRPMRAVFDPRRAELRFPNLFPGVDSTSAMALALRTLVLSRSGKDQPAHKRLDARRARISSGVRKGEWSLAVAIRGSNHEYAVRHALNLINELFLVLHESYPEYLVEHFGMSTE